MNALHGRDGQEGRVGLTLSPEAQSALARVGLSRRSFIKGSGALIVGFSMKTSMSDRQYCTKCGGHLMTNHPPLGMVDVYAATIPSVAFTPALHVNYAETVLPIRDGLPKLKDFPAEMGGSGTVLPE